MIWSENMIARGLALQVFNRKHLIVVPNCNWTGHECDLLCVTENLLVIDIEIKISRADLKVDAKKDKWWHREFKGYGDEVLVQQKSGASYRQRSAIYNNTPLAWPPKVWKHYYALPKEIWKPELLDYLASSSSGVILLSKQQHDNRLIATIARMAKPNKSADKISAAAAIDIARLTSLRMWDSCLQLEDERNRRLDREKAAA